MSAWSKKRSWKSLLYIDSNIFIHPIIHDPTTVPKAARAKAKLHEVAGGRVEACTSTLTWDEVMWSTRRFFGHAAAVTQGEVLLRAPNLRFLPADLEVIHKAQEIAAKHGLKPRDAIHAATALKNRVFEVLSYDPDFDVVPGLKRIEP